MGRVKDIQIKVIPASVANDFIKKHHYSGRVAMSALLHFGAFLDDELHGVLSYGNPIDKRRVLGLVKDTGWNEMLELNRMAFDDFLPKNSESRCIAVTLKLIRKHAPHVKWILSFSDASMCGDGSIYRACGFYLTSIKQNKSVMKTPNGTNFSAVSMAMKGIKASPRKKAVITQELRELGHEITETASASLKPFLDAGCYFVEGNQLRYIYLIDKRCEITAPVLQYSEIDAKGAGMYKGQKITVAERKKIEK